MEKEELARESDVLVVLCNLNESTKGIVGKDFLRDMKETAVLVNTARVSHSLQINTSVILFLTPPSWFDFDSIGWIYLGRRGRLARPRRRTRPRQTICRGSGRRGRRT